MLKKSLVVSWCVVSAFADFGFTSPSRIGRGHPAESGKFELEQKVQNKAKRLKRLVTENAASMTRRELKRLDAQLKKMIESIRFGSPTPIPRPNPGPRPPREIIVTGSIESRPFTFGVMDGLDLMNQCSQFFHNNNFSQVDEASVSVSGARSERVRTTGWWKSAGAVCYEIVKTAMNQGLAFPQSTTYQVMGVVEGKHFFLLEANRVAGLQRECSNFYQESRINGGVDEISVILNQGQEESVRTSGWWRNEYDVCGAILSVLN